MLNDLVEKDNFSKLKFVIYDGLILWLDYRLYFNVCVCFNYWLEVEKGMYLIVFLRGKVKGVFGNFFEYL